MRLTFPAIVALMLALPLACGGDEALDSAPEAATTSEAQPNEAERALVRYLAENFGPESPTGQTSWYDSITGVFCCSAFDGKATIEVTTFSESDGQSICTAVMLSGVEGVAGATVMNPEAGKIAECP
jgi:hypothetical protein